MWIHPKDKVKIGKENLEVSSVEGLYSCGGVTVVLKNIDTGKTKSFPLLDFNRLHDEGKIQVTQATKRITRGY